MRKKKRTTVGGELKEAGKGLIKEMKRQIFDVKRKKVRRQCVKWK